MDGKQKHYNNQVEITDLIPELVENALARRNHSLQERALSDLSDDEATSIAGGQIAVSLFKPIYPPIITVGLIAVDDKFIA
jgi:hypothetical protein